MNKSVGLASILILLASVVKPAYALNHPPDCGDDKQQATGIILPIVKRDSLLNGLQIILIQKQGTGSVNAHLRINSGALFDLAGKSGLADIAAGMMLRGGGGLDARNVIETVEQLGLTVNIVVGWDSTDIIVSGPADSLENIFDLLRRIVVTPAYEQKELDALKSMRVEATKAETPDDQEMVRRKALEMVFGAHPFGRPARGTAESLAQITRADLTYFHRRFYLANNAELIVTGDATAEQVTQLARSKLGAWNKGEKAPASFRPPETQTTRRVVVLDRPDAQRARAALAQVGISRRASDYFAAAVMGEMLAAIASKAGSSKTAVIDTEIEPRMIAGPMLIEIESSPETVAAVIDTVIAAMTQLQAGQVSLDQIEQAKTRIIEAFAERLRTPDGAATAILDIELYGLGRDYLINFADRVRAVTVADVERAAKAYLKPQSLTVVVAAPAEKTEAALKKFGPLTVSR